MGDSATELVVVLVVPYRNSATELVVAVGVGGGGVGGGVGEGGGWGGRGGGGGGARIVAPVQTGPAAHPGSYTTGSGSFPRVER